MIIFLIEQFIDTFENDRDNVVEFLVFRFVLDDKDKVMVKDKNMTLFEITSYHYLLIFLGLSVTNSFSELAKPAIPWISLGMIIFVDSPLDNSSNALNPCNVTYA